MAHILYTSIEHTLPRTVVMLVGEEYIHPKNPQATFTMFSLDSFAFLQTILCRAMADIQERATKWSTRSFLHQPVSPLLSCFVQKL